VRVALRVETEVGWKFVRPVLYNFRADFVEQPPAPPAPLDLKIVERTLGLQRTQDVRCVVPSRRHFVRPTPDEAYCVFAEELSQ
jgi:hypothetical protein